MCSIGGLLFLDLSGLSLVSALCSPKTFWPTTNWILISELSFRTGGASSLAPLMSCTVNGRILLANLLQSSRSTFSRGSFLSFFAFQEGILSRWREIRACNDNVYGESKGQNSHDSLLDLTFLIIATDPKAPIY